MKTILVVEDKYANRRLIEESLKEDKYRILNAEDGKQALDILSSGEHVDLIILDIKMPVMDGFQFLQIFTQNEKWTKIPVLVLTGFDERHVRLKTLDYGVQDFITKPFDTHELRLRVRNHLELKDYRDRLEFLVDARTKELREAYRKLEQTNILVLEKLGRAAELRDDETGQHIQRMARYSYELAKTLGIDDDVCELIFLAAPMHDIGKIGIPDGILLKPGRLFRGEFEIMKRHTTLGAHVLSGTSNRLLEMGRVLALYHHERWDGKGYPEGLKGKEIPREARIVALADVFDALTSARIYRPAWEIDRAVEYILDNREKQFDPEVVDAFKSVLDKLLHIREIYKDIPDARTHVLQIYEEYLRLQEEKHPDEFYNPDKRDDSS